jgi:hypothetical protein
MPLPSVWKRRKACPAEPKIYRCSCGGYKEKRDGVHWICTNPNHAVDLKRRQVQDQQQQARAKQVEAIMMQALRHCRA